MESTTSTQNQNGGSASGIAWAILGFLNEEFHQPTATTARQESLEVAMQCLETAYGLSLRDLNSHNSVSLREIYEAYHHHNQSPTPTTPRSMPTEMNFSHLVDGMSRLDTGSGEENGGIRAIEIPLGEPFTPPSTATDLQKRQGDELKETGNRLMKEGEFVAALEIYKRAVALDAGNAIYYCNRAAAYLKVGDLENGLRDAQIAVQLQPDYARAYGRMGVIYSTMGKHLEAYSCYKRAMELEPSNESYSNNLNVSKDLIEKVNIRPSGPAARIPIAEMAHILQNPQFIAMASQVLNDPAGMQAMLQTLVHDLQIGDDRLAQFFQMGREVVQQVREAHPEIVAEFVRFVNTSPRDPSNQNEINEDF